MALDELFKTFEFLKKRIEEHREYLSQDETRTRQVLIDPLLKELGWDVGDPSAVELEYRVEREYDVGMGKADYVLKSGLKLAAVIEAKRLGSTLLDKATNQVLNYANSKGVPWMIVSDGDRWTMYEVFKQGELKERLRMSFAISDTSASECALKTLALWRPNVCAVDGPVDALEPVLSDLPSIASIHAAAGVAGAARQVSTAVDAKDSLRGAWHPITDELPKGRPTMARIGDAAPSKWLTWKQFYHDVAMHLLTRGSISATDLPIRVTKGKNCVINDVPEHPDRRPFKAPVQLRRDMWLETYLNRDQKLELSRRLLRKYHDNPECVQVRYD